MYGWLCVIVACFAGCFCAKYQQEQAHVKYANPKYISSAQAFTGRLRRGQPYATNLTVTIKQPFGNNVTAEISYELNSNPPPLSMTVRMCDVTKHKWMQDFVEKLITFKITCPFPAMTYEIINLELPPKNFPMPIPKGTHRVNMIYYITNTKELILHITGIMHVL